MSGSTFTAYADGTDLVEAFRAAHAQAKRVRKGQPRNQVGIVQKVAAVPAQDNPVTHERAVTIALDLLHNHTNKTGDQFSNWCGAIPVCDDDGAHVGWLFAGMFHT